MQATKEINHIVVIGGGQAGGWAAKTLRDQGYSGHLSVVSDEPYDFYERPPLSKTVLLAEQAILPRLFTNETMAELQIDWHRPAMAMAINAESQIVILNNGAILPFDKLLIATGAKARIPANWHSPRVLTLRSWEDALQLKKQLASCHRLAIIGGGWIGLEVAATARKLGIAVTLFECQPRLCQRSIDKTVSDALLQLHQQQGVHILCHCGEITLEHAGEMTWVGCNQQAPQSFDLVVVGIGVEFNLDLAKTAGLITTQGIVVDAQGRTNKTDIFAAGDIACHPTLGICLQSWAYAQNQAIATAKAMLNDTAEGYQEIPWFWSDQYECNIQILGIAGQGQTYPRVTEQSQLYFTLNDQQQLLQLVAFNDNRVIKLAKRWLHSGRKLDPQQLTDPSFSLMTLK